MTNVQAAIGVAQVGRLQSQVKRHREVASWYKTELAGTPGLGWQHERDWAKHAWWQFVAIVEDGFGADRDTVIAGLQNSGIDARRLYYPTHQLPPFEESMRHRSFPVADDLAARGVCLPTWSGLERADVRYICDQLKKCSRHAGEASV
jgi:perosamine synthetase